MSHDVDGCTRETRFWLVENSGGLATFELDPRRFEHRRWYADPLSKHEYPLLVEYCVDEDATPIALEEDATPIAVDEDGTAGA
jgi:hypothetical protein